MTRALRGSIWRKRVELPDDENWSEIVVGGKTQSGDQELIVVRPTSDIAGGVAVTLADLEEVFELVTPAPAEEELVLGENALGTWG